MNSESEKEYIAPMKDCGTYWEISKVRNDFDKAFDKVYAFRKNLSKMWEVYSGFDYGQWEKEAIAKLKAQNRHIAQFNIIRGKVDGLASSLLKNPYDIDFVPVDGKFSDQTNILKTIYYSDKEMMNWGYEYAQSVLDGVICEGIEEMFISREYNELGNVAFKRIMPGHVIVDPNWKTNNDKDLKRLWKVSYMTVEEIKNKYPKVKKDIENKILMDRLNGVDYEDDAESSTIPQFNLDTVYASQYRIIEEHSMVTERKTIKYVMGRSDEIIDIPDGLSEEQLHELLEAYGLDLDTPVMTKKINKEVYIVRTICPELLDNTFLENKESFIQIGRLPFFIWSSARINGVNSGIIELLYDPQITLNKRQSLIDHIIATEAVGSLLIDPAVVDNDDTKVRNLIDNINKPDGRVITAPGALASGRQHIQRVPSANYNPEITNQVNMMMDYLDRLGKQTSTLDGQVDSSHETGILFARKQAQAEMALTIISSALENYNMAKGEAFMQLAQLLYSDTYREFTVVSEDGKAKGTLEINVEGGENQNGEPVIYNSIKALPRYKVVVSKSAIGVTQRETTRAINGELMRNIPGTNPISRARIIKNVMMTLDMTERERDAYLEAAQIEEQYAIEQTLAGISGLKAQRLQAEMQMQQMMNPPQPQQIPQEGGGSAQGGQPQTGEMPTGQTAEAAAAQQQASEPQQ